MELGRTRFEEQMTFHCTLCIYVPFVSEISTCSIVSLVHSCYLRKFHFAHSYLRQFHVSYFISENCVLQIIPALSIVFVNHVSTYRHATVFANNVVLPTANKQTDI